MNFRIGSLGRELSYSLRRSPSLFIGTLVTILISLTFLGGGLVVREAVNEATVRWQDGVEFIVFMNPEASAAEIDAVSVKLTASPEIESFNFLDKQAAFTEFQSIFSENPQIRDSVSIDDMPPSFRVAPLNPDSVVVEELASSYRNDPGVFQVVAAVDTIRQIEEFTNDINWVFTVVGLLLLGSALLLVYNTIRTTIFARRREVEVMRLVGASNWYIRLPFMSEGILQGLIGGLLTLPFLQWWNRFLSNLGQDGLALLSDLHAPERDMLWIWLVMAGLGALIGALASTVALSRFLDV